MRASPFMNARMPSVAPNTMPLRVSESTTDVQLAAVGGGVLALPQSAGPVLDDHREVLVLARCTEAEGKAL